MKTIFLILFSTISQNVFSQKQDTLHWNQNCKLKWEDFQGEPDTNSIGMAATVSGIYCRSLHEDDTSIQLIAYSIFYKKESWVKIKYKDTETLNHEQGHFNITEIYTRKLNKAFKKYKYNKATVSADVDSMFKYYFKEASATDSLYDKQTTFPINNKQQKIWDNKIDRWLINE